MLSAMAGGSTSSPPPRSALERGRRGNTRYRAPTTGKPASRSGRGRRGRRRLGRRAMTRRGWSLRGWIRGRTEASARRQRRSNLRTGRACMGCSSRWHRRRSNTRHGDGVSTPHLPGRMRRSSPAHQASDLRHLLDRIVGNGTAETAHRVCTVIGQVFDWAEARGEIEKNPQRLIRRAYPTAPSRHHAAIVEPAGFGALLRAIDGYQGRGITRAALQLLALCFLRSRELRGATWDEVDFATSTWTIPASRMKIRGNGHHVVPLAAQAVAILRELHTVTGPREGQKSTARHVFPGLRPGKVLSENTLNAALTTLGFGPDVHRVHGFRSSASTILNELAAKEGGRRFNFEHVEAQLAHRSGNTVRDAYQRSTFLEQRRLMMQAWADECDRLRALGYSRDAA